MSHMPAVTVDRVSKLYNGSPAVEALRDVSFTVPSGTLCLIEGPSGSGKTTLLGIMGGLERPTSGSVTIHRLELPGRPPRGAPCTALRRQIGFIFQDFKLVGALTAEENVALALQVRGMGSREARARSRALLERMGLGSRRLMRPAVLSGGEKQRVAVARALVPQPRLLLADEPTANLDTQTGAEIIRLLRHLVRQQDAAVLVVSHDPRLARHVDQTLHLVDGVLTRQGAK